MTDSATPNMQELYTFLGELAQNNNRVWFAQNKERYDRLRAWWIGQLQILIDKMALFDHSLAHVQAKDCLYRIYRDTRFSPDKTPYKHTSPHSYRQQAVTATGLATTSTREPRSRPYTAEYGVPSRRCCANSEKQSSTTSTSSGR